MQSWNKWNVLAAITGYHRFSEIENRLDWESRELIFLGYYQNRQSILELKISTVLGIESWESWYRNQNKKIDSTLILLTI